MCAKFIPRDCIGCGQPLVPNKNSKDRCWSCHGKAWQATHPGNAERCKAWHEAHREQAAKTQRAWDQANAARKRPFVVAYMKAHPEYGRERQRERRARVRNQFVERVSEEVVFNRDKGICHICKKKVERAKASLDHVVPIARGGEHSYPNIRLAHRLCNYRRNAYGPGQPLLL